MALSEDSRTLLQLLLGRGKSYSDISGLLGIDETEVRARAHQALTEINGSDPDVDVNLTDYLLGQSDPIARADVARELSENSAAADTAANLSDQLKLLVPGAGLPRLGVSAGAAAGPAKGKSTPPAAASKSKATPSSPQAAGPSSASLLSKTQLRLIAALVLVAILILIGFFVIKGSGNDDGDKAPTQAGPDAAVSLLQPVGSQQGTGKVQFGQADNQFAARLSFTDLQPTENGSSYVLWTVGSVGAFPLNESEVKKDGQISQTILVPAVVFCSIASDVFPEMRLSRLTDAERKEVLKATKEAVGGNQNKLPDYVGDTVFEGPIAMEQSLKDTVNQSCAAPTNTTGDQSSK